MTRSTSTASAERVSRQTTMTVGGPPNHAPVTATLAAAKPTPTIRLGRILGSTSPEPRRGDATIGR